MNLIRSFDTEFRLFLEIIFLLNLLDHKVSTDTLTSLVKKHTITNKSKWQRGNKHSSTQLELSPVRKALANRICGSKILIFMLRRVRLGQRKKRLYKLYHEEDQQRGEEYKNLGMLEYGANNRETFLTHKKREKLLGVK